MSAGNAERNVEIVRAAYADAGARERYEELLETVPDDFEVVQPENEITEAGTFHGRAAIESIYDWMLSFEDFEIDVERIEAIDDERILVVQNDRACVRGSSGYVTRRYAAICTVKEGQMRRVEFFTEVETALAAAGLTPPKR